MTDKTKLSLAGGLALGWIAVEIHGHLKRKKQRKVATEAAEEFVDSLHNFIKVLDDQLVTAKFWDIVTQEDM